MIRKPSHSFSRRDFLRQMGIAGVSLPLASMPAWADQQPLQLSPPPTLPPFTLSPEDDQFLNEMESANALYFWEQGSPKTGMVKDRCNAQTNDQGTVASIAATGFGLTALCIADQRGFIPADAALERVFAALRFLWKKVPQHRGFFLSLRQYRYRRTRMGLGDFIRRYGDSAVRDPLLPGTF
jgi:hypothetical protein